MRGVGRLAIPDLRPGGASDACIAVLRWHMIRQPVGCNITTPHKGGLSPWERNAANGRTLKGDAGVVYLTYRTAEDFVKRYHFIQRMAEPQQLGQGFGRCVICCDRPRGIRAEYSG